MGWKEDDKGRTGRNRNDKSIKELTVPSFLLSPHYRIYRHLLLQAVLLLIAINVFGYEPLQGVSLWRRLGGCFVYFASMNIVIYVNLYLLVPCLLLKNRAGGFSYKYSSDYLSFGYSRIAFRGDSAG